jgi:hypothetical protein
MPQVRRILRQVSVETASRKRICHRERAKHEILKGEECLVIHDPVSGGSKNYCGPCALAILDIAADDLSALREHFE